MWRSIVWERSVISASSGGAASLTCTEKRWRRQALMKKKSSMLRLNPPRRGISTLYVSRVNMKSTVSKIAGHSITRSSRRGRFKWDSDEEDVEGEPAASQVLGRKARRPWDSLY